MKSRKRVTDPLGDEPSASGQPNVLFPMAWIWDDHNGGQEIGDICAWNKSYGKVKGPWGKTFTIQGEWSNAKKACYAEVN